MSDQIKRIRSLIHPNILDMDAYHVQEASGLIKLDAMENPYAIPDELVESWLEAIRACDLNRYPDPCARTLASTIRKVNDIPESCELIFGNGSDELIQIILMAVAVQGSTVLAPEPSFVMYRQIAKSLGLEFVGVPLKQGSFDLDMDAMNTAIHQYRPTVVFLAYPNNPTGNLFKQSDIDALLTSAPGLIVIDEAYSPFAQATYMNQVAETPNLLLMRTVSKLGLAGLRLGYLVGNPLWIEQFNKIRLPYNINVLTQVTADFALSNTSIYQNQSNQICIDREQLFNALAALKGITPFPSKANFILFRIEDQDASAVYQKLKEAGILIKNMNTKAGLLANCLRVTVGKPSENERFIYQLQQAILP